MGVIASSEIHPLPKCPRAAWAGLMLDLGTGTHPGPRLGHETQLCCHLPLREHISGMLETDVELKLNPGTFIGDHYPNWHIKY